MPLVLDSQVEENGNGGILTKARMKLLRSSNRSKKNGVMLVLAC
jgi:hypothetical protein